MFNFLNKNVHLKSVCHCVE